jgi:nicotinate-nucleotide pyrophosphorylase (carboxylating)
MGLYDAVLVKDNHLAGTRDDELASFITRVAWEARSIPGAGRPSFIEVEVDRVAQLERLLTLPAGAIDIVLLDNMTINDLRSCAALRDAQAPKLELEASGGVSLESIAAIAGTGVDRISVGSLTHGARSVDLALDFNARAS